MTLQEWERDVLNRQRNIVFPDTVLNEGRFFRNITSGKAVYTRGQKISILVMVAFYFFVNAGNFALALTELVGRDHSHRHTWDLWPSMSSLMWLLFWIFLAVKSLVPAPPPPRRHRRGYLKPQTRSK